MRLKPAMLLFPLALAACGSTKTVVVNPPENRTVVVQPSGDVDIVRHDDDRDRR
jgi:hypothetical protein